MNVLNFGSLNLDYVYQVDHMVTAGETLSSAGMKVFCGGKGLNQSIALAKAGVPVWHAGLIGKEGGILRKTLEENGVHTGFVSETPGQCGHTIIQVDKNGQNCILLYGGANRCITREFAQLVLWQFEAGDMLLLQNEINELPYIIDYASERGLTIVMNPSPFDDRLKECDFSKVSIFLVNEIEGWQITGEKEPERILEKMKQLYPEAAVVLTLGSDGSMYQDKTGVYRQDCVKVKAVDTTAAGDTFTGYFLYSRMQGMPAADGLALAAKAAAIAVTRPGAADSIPRRAEVEACRVLEDGSLEM